MTEKELPSSAEQQRAIDALREAIETTVGKRIQTPKDFDFLSQLIEERCGEHMSVSTLKRVWGYVASNSMPRRSTLNILAQLIGKKDWDDFCASENNSGADCTQKAKPKTNQKRKLSKRILIFAAIVLAGFITIIYFICEQRAASSMVLHAGETFATTDEYLNLFDVQDRHAPWSVPVPNHPGLIIWGRSISILTGITRVTQTVSCPPSLNTGNRQTQLDSPPQPLQSAMLTTTSV